MSTIHLVHEIKLGFKCGLLRNPMDLCEFCQAILASSPEVVNQEWQEDGASSDKIDRVDHKLGPWFHLQLVVDLQCNSFLSND